MNQDIKNRWVEALRSGEYSQGVGFLRKNDAFCCLGVLCEIAVKDGVILPASTSIQRPDGVYEYAGYYGVLPHEVEDWAELDFENPLVLPVPGAVKRVPISDLNDDGHTFSEIADIIDDQL